MTSRRTTPAQRRFPRGTTVFVPYEDRECDGTVLEHTPEGTVRVALHAIENGNSVFRYYDITALRKAS